MDMYKLMSEKLSNLPINDETELLRELIEQLYHPAVIDVTNRYNKLKEQVFSELIYVKQNTSIQVSVTSRSNCPKLKSLFPVCPEELPHDENARLAFENHSSNKTYWGTAFFQVDYLEIQKFGDSFEVTGEITNGNEDIKVMCLFNRTDRYLAKVKTLYQIFKENNTPWTTVNFPYMNKFFDIYIFSNGRNLEQFKSQSSVLRIDLDFPIIFDMIPVWSVRNMKLTGDDYPTSPAGGTLIKYRFDKPEESLNSKYLVDCRQPGILSFEDTGVSIEIISDMERDFSWTMFEIYGETKDDPELLHNEIVSNSQRESFAARMVESFGPQIKTRAEIIRIIRSFKDSSSLALCSLKVIKGYVEGETYDMNPFVTDSLRKNNKSKSMVIGFRTINDRSFIDRDVMSFIVSHIQLIYPEYNCVGVLS